MSSPATHEDLSQFLNKFPSGSESSIVISSDIPSPALDEVFSRHQAHYLEKLLQVEKLEPEKWTEFIQTHCDLLLKVTISRKISGVRNRPNAKTELTFIFQKFAGGLF